jgi:catechol 2,3-dioxygenase-like lactoylglutathione lyase family enzyme
VADANEDQLMMRILSPLDHLDITPADHDRALAFYDRALAPLGIQRLVTKSVSCGFGIERPFFWLDMPDVEHPPHQHKVHIAFSAGSKEEVEAFYAAALEAGGTDNGAPGYRPQYDEGYYAAFVLDLDGNNIEAVYRESKLNK